MSEATNDTVLDFASIHQRFAAPGGGDMLVLADVSLRMRVGEFVAVIGPSGCGKSTLLQMAAGLLAPSAGTVTHRGRAVRAVNREIGFVPQGALLLPWKTLLGNVEFPLALRGVPAAERRARALDAIRRVDLSGFEHHHPHQLSGGMQKRASIARMLVCRPDVILMDEPFGALDAQTRMVMQHDLQALVAETGAAVLFVTHDITEAVLLADRVVVLSRRPARCIADIPVAFARPRDVFEPFAVSGFAAAYDQVWRAFRDQLSDAPGRRAA